MLHVVLGNKTDELRLRLDSSFSEGRIEPGGTHDFAVVCMHNAYPVELCLFYGVELQVVSIPT